MGLLGALFGKKDKEVAYSGYVPYPYPQPIMIRPPRALSRAESEHWKGMRKRLTDTLEDARETRQRYGG
jgi:hypothetical protein